MKTAVYPGSFDPVTLGHMDIIHRAALMFDHLTVAVGININKRATFSPEERVDFLKRAIAAEGLHNVTVEAYHGLIADYAASLNANTLVRGLRAMSDFESEFQMALANRRINQQVDTAFLVTNVEYMYLSSSLVREIGHYGGDISEFVPQCLAEDIAKRLKQNKPNI
ncbi:MAG: pantetheine-phosphate adenylyltransferase [Clostridiales bacterium]|jgi:pantetheine-phosphate adenylyltransferase|nr:pantetheine-phosphate adenylyltransferase [Clostridiales bacterium]